mgnify:CR=1 FL=1
MLVGGCWWVRTKTNTWLREHCGAHGEGWLKGRSWACLDSDVSLGLRRRTGEGGVGAR